LLAVFAAASRPVHPRLRAHFLTLMTAFGDCKALSTINSNNDGFVASLQ
jgi:hypothetical protein